MDKQLRSNIIIRQILFEWMPSVIANAPPASCYGDVLRRSACDGAAAALCDCVYSQEVCCCSCGG